MSGSRSTPGTATERRRESLVPPLLVLAVALAFALAPLGRSEAAPSRAAGPLAAVQTWGFAIGNHTLSGNLRKRYAGYDLLVVDAQEAKRRQIAALRAQGTLVLGYLSVGTIENYRPWYRRLKPYRIAPDGHWHGEYYAQVRKRGYRHQIVRRIAPKLYAKGFDGLFLDNVDMIEIYRRQTRGMHRLVGALSRLVHRNGGYLFGQNGFSIVRPMLSDLDGWNREDVTGTYRFGRHAYVERRPKQIERTQRELRAVARHGLLVTATDYTARARSRVARHAVANACAAGALPYVSDIYLRRTPRPPPSCTG